MRNPVVVVRASRLFALVARVTRPLRRRIDLNYVYDFDLARPVPELKAEIPVEMTRATREDVEAAAAIAGLPLREKFLARLDDGMTCFVAKVDGQVVAYNWMRYRSGEDEGDELHLGPGEIYTTDAYTTEGFRGRKIHGETLAYLLRVAQEEGYRTAYTMGSALKRGARKTMPRIGWRLSGRILRVRLGKRSVVLRVSGSSRPLRATAA